MKDSFCFCKAKFNLFLCFGPNEINCTKYFPNWSEEILGGDMPALIGRCQLLTLSLLS